MKSNLLKCLVALTSVFAIFLIVAGQEAELQVPQQVRKQLAAAKADPQVYIVIMDLMPAIAYEGDIEGFEPTKPGKGGKINPNSAHVQKYTKFLEQKHNQTLEAVGAVEADKIHGYTVALNGFAAKLSKEQVDAIKDEPGVVLVRPDEMRYPTMDSSPAFLDLDAEGGSRERKIRGEGIVVGIIDSETTRESQHSDVAGSSSLLQPAQLPAISCKNKSEIFPSAGGMPPLRTRGTTQVFLGGTTAGKIDQDQLVCCTQMVSTPAMARHASAGQGHWE